MPVVTVNDQKTDVPEGTTLETAIKYLCTDYDRVCLRGERDGHSYLYEVTSPKDFKSPYVLQEGDDITTLIDVFDEDGTSYEFFTGATVTDYIEDVYPPYTQYTAVVNGTQAPPEQVLKRGDIIVCTKCIYITIQGNKTYVPEGTTLLEIYLKYHWDPEFVNSETVLNQGDVIKFSKNH